MIVAEIRKKSQKPDQIYQIIDLMMPNVPKIELFARNNAARPKTWLALGNQLGPIYNDIDNLPEITCTGCKSVLEKNSSYFKSKRAGGASAQILC